MSDLVSRLRAVSTTEIMTMYDLTREAADRIEALEAELAEAKRDAERYRWIKAHVYSTGHTSGPNMDPITHWGFDAPDDEFWASIDAAMADKARGA